MSITVDAALGDKWEALGELITASGQEDSSGYRRMLAEILTEDTFTDFQRAIPVITQPEFETLRQRFRQSD